jgi:hypothetical protein
MMLLFENSGVFICGLSHNLGRVRGDLVELEAAKLLSNPMDTLSKIGYEHNLGVGTEESFLTLAREP